MNIHNSLLILAGLCSASLSAQSQLLQFELTPGTASFTSRGGVGMDSGEIHQGVHASHFRGLGERPEGCQIAGVGGWLQDQDISTQEFYHWVVRGGSDTTGPLPGPGSELSRIGPFVSPYGPPATPATIRAWEVTTTLSSPIRLPDCQSFFSWGLLLGPSALWTADGLSCHGCSGDVTSTAFPDVQYAHPRAEDHAWQLTPTQTLANHPSMKRTWRIRLLFSTPLLQTAANNNSYGMGGLFPRSGVPFAARARFGTHMANSSAMLFLGSARTAGVPLFVDTTRVYLGGIVLPLWAGQTDPSGGFFQSLTNSVPASLASSGSIYLQAVATGNGLTELTNSITVTF